MSHEHVLNKTGAVWNSFAISAAELIEDAGGEIRRYQPLIVMTANSLLGSYLGYRFAGKAPHEFWEQMAFRVPQNFAAIASSNALVEKAEELLYDKYNIRVSKIPHHTAIWSGATAINAMSQIDGLVSDPRRRSQFAQTSGWMGLISALPDPAIDVIVRQLNAAAETLRKSTR